MKKIIKLSLFFAAIAAGNLAQAVVIAGQPQPKTSPTGVHDMVVLAPTPATPPTPGVHDDMSMVRRPEGHEKIGTVVMHEGSNEKGLLGHDGHGERHLLGPGGTELPRPPKTPTPPKPPILGHDDHGERHLIGPGGTQMVSAPVVEEIKEKTADLAAQLAAKLQEASEGKEGERSAEKIIANFLDVLYFNQIKAAHAAAHAAIHTDSVQVQGLFSSHVSARRNDGLPEGASPGIGGQPAIPKGSDIWFDKIFNDAHGIDGGLTSTASEAVDGIDHGIDGGSGLFGSSREARPADHRRTEEVQVQGLLKGIHYGGEKQPDFDNETEDSTNKEKHRRRKRRFFGGGHGPVVVDRNKKK